MSMPYYRRYPRDFIEGTIGMGLELKGAYSILLDLIYVRNGHLPDDQKFIAGNLGCSVKKWNSIRDQLITMGKIIVHGGFITNFRADLELENYAKLSEKNAENASKPRKNNSLSQPNASKPEPEPEPDIYITTINARAPVDPNDWARMLEEARAAAGDQLDLTSTGTMHAADLRALVEPRAGEPCDWSEVLAAIGMVRARSERTGNKIKSWAWIREDAIRLRDKRLGAVMPGVVVPMVPAGAGPPSLSLPARIGAEVDRATARAREMFERENANHG